MVMMIVSGALIFGQFLTVTRIPYNVADWVISLPVPGVVTLGVIFLIYAIGGMLMDSLALLLITIPIFFPVAISLGYDPIWFGITITIITTMGAITPPVGATAYIVAGMSKGILMDEVFKGVSYFIPAYFLSVLLCLIFPQIILFLTQYVN